jgi:hypothetical protein
MMITVNFATDEALDADIADAFIDQKVGNLDFGQERIVNLHPELALWKGREGADRTKAMVEYVKRYYSTNIRAFEKNLSLASKIWDEINDSFFREMAKIFGELDFYPHKRMTGKLSAFACAVIEDDGHSFQIRYSLPTDNPHEFSRGVAHEAVHFLSDAFMTRYGFTDLLADWDFREILPVIILNKPSILALTKQPEYGYNQHQGKFLDYYQELWNKSENFLEFLHNAQKAKETESPDETI